MAFDVKRIQEELAAAPLHSPYPSDLAAAIVADRFRLADPPVAPPPDGWWSAMGMKRTPYREEQLGMLAHALASTSLGGETERAIGPDLDAVFALDWFLDAIAPLTAEMIRSNAFRQEEFIRRWIEAIGGTVEGETAKASRARLSQLDYRKALAELERAEKARAQEAERRATLLREAAEREAAARGWRE